MDHVPIIAVVETRSNISTWLAFAGRLAWVVGMVIANGSGIAMAD